MSNCYPVPAAVMAAMILSGCIGPSVPGVSDITRPTTEAFARLGSWRPWQPAEVEPVAPLAPVESAPLAPPAAQPAVVAQNPRPATRPRPASVGQPAPLPATRTNRGQQVPSSISCQTVANPGQRVRMECKPAG